jgi:flagellar export protein FliJ
VPPFAFRAAAALDLRRRREELATRALVEAQAASERADRSLEDARRTLEETLARSASAAHDPGLRIWYRNWIARQHQDVLKRRAMAADRRMALEAATAKLQAAHRDVRVLERLRDRLHAAWALEETRREQKDMDWIGSVRHALRNDRSKEDEWP